jgi:hypothetical protein
MKILTLARSYTPYGVWGRLSMPSGLTLCTLERPWENNERELSCIPPGSYECIRIDSPKFADTFEVIDVVNRSHILFHVGNDINDSKGCILVGQRMAIESNRLKIYESEKGFNEFMSELKKTKRFRVKISSYSPAKPISNLGKLL